jgi:hypothetical protein
MIIWRGWGILTPLIALACVAGPVALAGSSSLAPIAFGASLVLAAVLNWLLGQKLNRPLREADFDHGRRHSFFFIPMEWWSVAMLIGAVSFFIGLAR